MWGFGIQWGEGWGMERVCRRGAIREICGKVLGFSACLKTGNQRPQSNLLPQESIVFASKCYILWSTEQSASPLSVPARSGIYESNPRQHPWRHRVFSRGDAAAPYRRIRAASRLPSAGFEPLNIPGREALPLRTCTGCDACG